MSIKRLSRVGIFFIGVLLVALPLIIIVTQQQQQVQQKAATQEATFTFVNNTNQTIWVGALNNPGHMLPNNGGWALASHESVNVSVPNDWAGRFWGRTGCRFDSQGNGTCETGDCGGHLQCNGAGGAPPASLAEFTLNGAGGKDFYDVSLVDGANLPMFINTVNSSELDPITSNGCINRPASSGPSGCTTDVNAICPGELQMKNALGEVIGCKSACMAFNTDQYCCRGAYGTPDTCNHTTWPVDYAYQVFKKAQPLAYSYAYDDASSTFTCPHCNYRITFGVPSSNTSQPSVNPSSPTPAFIPNPTIHCLGSCPLSPSPEVTALPTDNLSTTPITNPTNPLPPNPGGNRSIVIDLLLQLIQSLLQFIRSLF